MYYSNSERYEGEWFEGRRDGKGTQHFSDGSRYEGDWLEDRKDGKGFAGRNGRSVVLYEREQV